MSSALLRVRVLPDGGEPFEVEVTSRDMLRWEMGGRDRSYVRLMEQQDIEPMYELAWIAADRMGLYRGSLAAFQSTCDITGAESDQEDAAAADPTPRARSRTPRSRSQSRQA